MNTYMNMLNILLKTIRGRGQGTNSVKHIVQSTLWVGGYQDEKHELLRDNNFEGFHYKLLHIKFYNIVILPYFMEEVVLYF